MFRDLTNCEGENAMRRAARYESEDTKIRREPCKKWEFIVQRELASFAPSMSAITIVNVSLPIAGSYQRLSTWVPGKREGMASLSHWMWI